MSGPTPPAPAVGPDTLITIKILQNDSVNRRFKIPLRDLGARVFPQKVCFEITFILQSSHVNRFPLFAACVLLQPTWPFSEAVVCRTSVISNT
jgi:hypothetical protein